MGGERQVKKTVKPRVARGDDVSGCLLYTSKDNEMASFKGQIDILDHMAFPEIFIDIL